MEIKITSLLAGAREARGTVIIVDVLRAYTTAAVMLDKGAEKIILVSEVKKALDLRDKGVGNLCVGEVDGMKPEHFDYNNSPSEVLNADLRNKTVIQSTRAGTVGVNEATQATNIYGGSFVIAQATVNSILKEDPKLVTIVAMGLAGQIRADEDEQCALYLRNLLQGRQPQVSAVTDLVSVGEEAQKYGDLQRPHYPIADRDIALEVDRFNFPIVISKEGGLNVARSS